MSFFVDVTVGALGIIGIECICLRICFVYDDLCKSSMDAENNQFM